MCLSLLIPGFKKKLVGDGAGGKAKGSCLISCVASYFISLKLNFFICKTEVIASS